MEPLLEAIRAAIVDGAPDETRAAGAHACRTILAALDARPGEPIAAPVANTSPVETAVGLLRGMPPEQLLDLAIARLKAALPAGAEVAPAAPVRFHILPVAGIGRRP